MKRVEIKSLITVFEVKNMEKALSWYQNWLGEPDVMPMEGVAEYQIADNAWLQLSCEDKEETMQSAIVLGVEDIEATYESLSKKGMEVGDIMDYEVVLVFDITDLDGNRITFAQEVK